MEEFDLGVKYSAKDFYDWHNKLTGSCEMGRKVFMRNRGMTFENEFTVEEFIELTKNDYEGEIILQLAEAIEEKKA